MTYVFSFLLNLILKIWRRKNGALDDFPIYTHKYKGQVATVSGAFVAPIIKRRTSLRSIFSKGLSRSGQR